ncbi:MAG: DNA-binding protein [Chitinivibrionia bacterium]|nr:DNA-binding protein [Chitinivibrionia bacterium]
MKFASFGTSYILKLERGEEVVETLTRFAGDVDIAAGVINGIGAVRQCTLGYFDPDTKEYSRQLIEESCEVANLSGTTGRFEGKPVLHLHATLADAHHRTTAGHLFSAVVSATLEVHIMKLPGELVRKRDDFTGLNLLDLP